MATWQKLKDGSWGVRVAGAAKVGDSVTVTKKSGETQKVSVSRVVWSGDGITLCAVGSTGGQSSSRGQSGCCVNCQSLLSQWERNHGVRRCIDCRDGGGNAHGGMSYRDRNGNFVLGDDD